MKSIINRRTIIIFSTALLLAVIAIVSINVFNTSGPVTGVANIITRPIRSLASSVAQAFGSIFSAIYEYDEVVAQRDELLRQVAEMEGNYRESQRIAEENARLRALITFSETHGDFEREMASLEGWGSDNWSSTLSVDKGYANSGISAGMAVVTEEGVLIGQIYSVGAYSSTVITVLDTKFSAAAHVGQSDTGEYYRSSAVAKGSFSYMGSGMLVLDNIGDDIVVRRNDFIITSGIADVFPNGLIIGQVHDVYRHENGIGQYALIKPMVTFDTIKTVFIITNFSGTGFGADGTDIGTEAPNYGYADID